MKTSLFSEGWQLQRGTGPQLEAIRLPHDAMIGEARSANASTGNHGGYFPGGSYRYSKQWLVPPDADQKQYRLFFEGVYGDSIVSVDGREIARCNSGYRGFHAPLDGCAPNSTVTIEVLVDNSKTPNTRWYSGSGINRPVWLQARGPVHIADDGIHLVTRALSPVAIVDVSVQAATAGDDCTAVTVFSDETGEVASTELQLVDGEAKGELLVPGARPWSSEDPQLYQVQVQLVKAGIVIDERRLRTGLRTIEVDAQTGLRINGRETLLRGACVHSDNGLLGTVTLPDAEYRRVRILKEAGFNAIRASHNPFQRGFLDACDELGMYVLDELTDVWFQQKTDYDNSSRFEDVWPQDARAMVAEDRNRPAVIMYSIGNEVAETATEKGVEAAGRINDFMKQLDASRPTTLAVNMLLNVMAARSGRRAAKRGTGDRPARAHSEKREATSTAANMLTAKLGAIMGLAARLPAADRASREVFTRVDVAGYNYAFGRYRGDRKKYPQRVILGTESMPGDLPAIWKRVTSVPGVLGDFMWTGWDYLGESGIGAWSYGDETGGLNKPYPALTAGCGAIDICGLPGAPTLLSRAVWGLLDAPAIAVRPMIHSGKRTNKTPWRTTDAVSSWAWRGASGKAEIEVYSSDEQVELLLNGRSLGRKRAGEKTGFVTRFKVPYEPGELVAVGYRQGTEAGRSSLHSASEPKLSLRAESTTIHGGHGLAYIALELADSEGVVESMAEDVLSIAVEGAAELLGFGSADPRGTDAFTGTTCSTYLGRAQAILRGSPTPGEVTVTVRSERHGDAQISLTVS
jgi:beta-galactosidase